MGVLSRLVAERGATISFLPFQTIEGDLENDLALARRLCAALGTGEIVLPEPGAPWRAVEAIAGLDLLVAMRLHAVVRALCGVPFVALAYDPKVTALARGWKPNAGSFPEAGGRSLCRPRRRRPRAEPEEGSSSRPRRMHTLPRRSGRPSLSRRRRPGADPAAAPRGACPCRACRQRRVFRPRPGSGSGSSRGVRPRLLLDHPVGVPMAAAAAAAQPLRRGRAPGLRPGDGPVRRRNFGAVHHPAAGGADLGGRARPSRSARPACRAVPGTVRRRRERGARGAGRGAGAHRRRRHRQLPSWTPLALALRERLAGRSSTTAWTTGRPSPESAR